MNPPNLDDYELNRLKVLHAYHVLDTPPEESFDELARLAGQICDMPMALVSFLDRERIWVKSRIGLEISELPRSASICDYVIEAQDVLIVEDASQDKRFSDLPMVSAGPKVRFFAGIALQGSLGANEGEERYPIGILCVLDTKPRKISPEQTQALQTLGRQVMAQLDLRKSCQQLRARHTETEKALRHSESFYHSLVEAIPQNIFRKDPKGRFTFANSSFCRAVSRPLAEILGKTDFDLFPPELAAKYQQDDRRVLERREPLRTIEQYLDGQGNQLYVQVIKTPLIGADGEVTGLQGIFWDETDRFKAEEQLAYERDLLRAMIENIPDSIYFKDRHSRFLAVSRSLATRLGLNNPDEAIGKTDADFFDVSHAEAALQDERSILRTGEPLVAKMEREVWIDGRERWVLTTKVPLRNAQGEIRGTFGISKDITELKTVEAELAQARDVAVESARLKSEFLANMSHEIRTPLNAVIGMTGLLLETELSRDQRDFAETVRKSAEALLNIINDILDFSKIEAGKMAIEAIDFDLNEVVEGTLELLAETAQVKGVELASWIHEDAPRYLRGDPGRLRQVLTNLVANAVKFTPKGEVVVDVNQTRDSEREVRLKFSVRDTGIGISFDAQQRLFQAFVQADGATTRRYGGTGLGLAICKQLVDLMGGKMGFESALGQGSTFWFEVPLMKQPEQQPRAAMASTLEGFRVLIVDDNEANREIIDHQIAAWKTRNGSADSGPAALALLEEAAREGDPFQLAILDMQMPDMDGLALARAIRANPSIPPVQLVMLTSLGYLPEDREWRDAGITAYLVKPVKESRLYDTLVSVLRGSNQRRRGEPPVERKDGTQRAVRILVAEDNTVNQKVTLRQLQKLGYSADAVANGLEVFEAIKRIPYDLILMDCQMPELDGYEATRLIRSQESKNDDARKRLYIVAMTANALAGDREKCLRAGMDDYISKPVRVDDLDAAILRGCQSLVDADATALKELLDPEVLKSVRDLRTPGESDPLAELVDLFLQDTPNRIARMLDVYKDGNAVELERAAHSLKGSASNLGAKCLAAACFEVVKASKDGKLPESSLVARVLSEFERLKPALEAEKEK